LNLWLIKDFNIKTKAFVQTIKMIVLGVVSDKAI